MVHTVVSAAQRVEQCCHGRDPSHNDPRIAAEPGPLRHVQLVSRPDGRVADEHPTRSLARQASSLANDFYLVLAPDPGCERFSGLTADIERPEPGEHYDSRFVDLEVTREIRLTPDAQPNEVTRPKRVDRIGAPGSHRGGQLRTGGTRPKRTAETEAQQSCQPAHAAPTPRSTAGTVLIRMRKSRASDHRSIYSRSNRIHSSKPSRQRPWICQRQVRPGRMLKRRMAPASVNLATSRTDIGRGPTSDISPRR